MLIYPFIYYCFVTKKKEKRIQSKVLNCYKNLKICFCLLKFGAVNVIKTMYGVHRIMYVHNYVRVVLFIYLHITYPGRDECV